MNIGFDASRAFTSNRTGTENYSFQILKHLVQMDHTNNYYIYLRPGLESGRWKVEDPPSNKFITIPYPRLWTQVGLAKQTFIDKLDVLFIPAHTIPLVRKPGLKTVVTVHDLGAEFLPKTHQVKQRLYLNLMTHHQLKSATHIIAVSEATKDDLVRKVGILKERISVIYEGYNKELYKPVKGDALLSTLKQFDLENRQYFLFVGTIQPRKNIARLITAYALARGITGGKGITSTTGPNPRDTRDTRQPHDTFPTLVLAGSRGWLSDEIYKLPKKLGIEDQVMFLGYVPDEDLPALYSGAKAFLFPSLFEGFGLPVLEAMACGCPVLTSDLGSMKEIVTIKNPPSTLYHQKSTFHPLPSTVEYAAILVEPYSIDAIATGIERVQSPESRVKLIKAGFEQVKKFSWEKAAQQTLEVLEKVSKTK